MAQDLTQKDPEGNIIVDAQGRPVPKKWISALNPDGTLQNQYQMNPISVSPGADIGYNPQVQGQERADLSRMTSPVQFQNLSSFFAQNYGSVPQVQNDPNLSNEVRRNVSGIPQVQAQNYLPQIAQNFSGVDRLSTPDLTNQLQSNIYGAGLDQSGINAIQNRAFQQGPSAWLQAQQGLLDQQQQAQLDQANQGAQGAEATAEADLMSHGGVRSGDREELARQSMLNAQQAQQQVRQQTGLLGQNLQVADEAQKNQFLQMLPQDQLASAQYGLSQAQAANQAAQQQQGVGLQVQQQNQNVGLQEANALNQATAQQAGQNLQAGTQNQLAALQAAGLLNQGDLAQATQGLEAQQANQNANLNIANNLNNQLFQEQSLGLNTGFQNNAQGMSQAGMLAQTGMGEEQNALNNQWQNRQFDLGAGQWNAQNNMNAQQYNIGNALQQSMQQNLANLQNYHEQMSAWAAAKSGQAEQSSGKK